MEEFFLVLKQSLGAARWPSTGPAQYIQFRVTGLRTETWVISLSSDGCHVMRGERASPDLTLYCDNAQLEEMLKTGFSTRALRFVGDSRLLDELARLLPNPLDVISVRATRRSDKP